MELNKLCIIVPADFDADTMKTPDKVDVESPHLKRGCGAHLVDLIKSSLSDIYDSTWVNLCVHEPPTKTHRQPRRRRSSRALSSSFRDMDGAGLTDKEVGSDNPRIFSYSELYIGSNGFSHKELLGSGGFGRVYKAVLPSDGTTVAVKCVAEEGERFEKAFAAELVAVAHLRHRNLVRLRGWCIDEGRLLLVYDYMPNRSLDRALFRRAEGGAEPMGWQRRKRIVEGLAAALYYLHEQLDTQIVHRDVKASNVMLDSQYNARLGDFGLARWLEHGPEWAGNDPESGCGSGSGSAGMMFRLAETSRIGGTIGYLPPESLRRKGAATAKSDVFSFGIVVLEVVSGRRAVDLACPEDEIVLLDWVRGLSDEGAALRAGDARIRDGTHELADMERLIHVALLCTLHAPHSRPNMKWVADALSGSLPGKLPPLPSFRSHPKYINLSSPSDTSTSTNTSKENDSSSTATASTSVSSIFATAREDTVYATANDGSSASPPRGGSTRRPAAFPMVQTPREISYAEIVSATDGFSDSKRVAELDFGTAYRGVLGGGEGPEVLVKRLGMKTCPALRVRFSVELQNLGRLRHRNLVQLRGWCTEHGEMLVVYDYSPSRLLSRAIFDRGSASPCLRWHHRYNAIKSLASAVCYLHEEWDEQVIHRNITSSAVILDPDANPRLGSFALAEFLTRNEHGHHVATPNSSKSVRGIFGYMAPEYVGSGEATTAADVYSFGVVILEVVSGQMAVDFRRPEVLLVKRVREFMARKRPLEDLADVRLHGEYNPRELARLVKLGAECTWSDPGSRPSMRQIVRILDGNDKWFVERVRRSESVEQWKKMNASSLSLVKKIQALGIQ